MTGSSVGAAKAARTFRWPHAPDLGDEMFEAPQVLAKRGHQFVERRIDPLVLEDTLEGILAGGQVDVQPVFGVQEASMAVDDIVSVGREPIGLVERPNKALAMRRAHPIGPLKGRLQQVALASSPVGVSHSVLAWVWWSPSKVMKT